VVSKRLLGLGNFPQECSFGQSIGLFVTPIGITTLLSNDIILIASLHMDKDKENIENSVLNAMSPYHQKWSSPNPMGTSNPIGTNLIGTNAMSPYHKEWSSPNPNLNANVRSNSNPLPNLNLNLDANTSSNASSNVSSNVNTNSDSNLNTNISPKSTNYPLEKIKTEEILKNNNLLTLDKYDDDKVHSDESKHHQSSCMYICVCICKYTFIYEFIYKCIHVHVYVYIYR
jgi:hypothetical protein